METNYAEISATIDSAADRPDAPLTTLALIGKDELDDFFSALHRRDHASRASCDTIRATFERFAVSQVRIRAELAKLTIKDLTPLARPLYSGSKKDALVGMVLTDYINRFAWLTAGDSPTLTKAYNLFGKSRDEILETRTLLAGLTEQRLEIYLAARDARRAEMAAARKARVEAVTNPQTIEDFEQLIRLKGRDKLTPAEQVRYDDLVAAKAVAERRSKIEQRAQVAGVAIEAQAEIIRAKHTRKGHDIWVVKLSQRVDPDAYKILNTAARQLGGYYSTYAKDGAVPGFTFDAQQPAKEFLSVAQGQDVVSETVKERTAGKVEHQADKLEKAAARLREKAEESLGRERLANTPKRAREASAAEAAARQDLSRAETVTNLAAAIRSRSAVSLDGLTDMIQIELLQKTLRSAHWARAKAENFDAPNTPVTVECASYAEMPTFFGHAAQMADLLRELMTLPDTLRLQADVRAIIDSSGPTGSGTAPMVQREWVARVAEKLGSSVTRVFPWYWREKLEDCKRLDRMGIESVAHLRAALREFVTFRAGEIKADRAKEAERALVGSTVGVDFFPTPPELAARMVAMAGVEPGMRVLEPSAGNGNIAEAIRASGVEPDVAEISEALREVLALKGFNLVARDFLEYAPDESYRAVCMNPPFGNNADIAHVMHAYGMLSEGGTLVAIVGEGAFNRAGAAEATFRHWLAGVATSIEKLPDGTFSDRRLLATTSANARLVLIRK